MRRNEESIPLLQDDSIFNWVYPRLIANSKYRDVILQVLGQVIVAQRKPSDLDIFGTPANSSFPQRIEQILGLEWGTVIEALEDIDLTHGSLGRDEDIKIRHPPFLCFLLDRSRSQEIFVDLDDARRTFRFAPIRQGA